MALDDHQNAGKLPLLMLMACSDDPASEQWLARREAEFAFTQRVQLTSWAAPQPAIWLDLLNGAIQAADRPVVLITQGVACLAVAWWVEKERLEGSDRVQAAVMHEPPILAEKTAPGPYPTVSMPFLTCLLASRTGGFAELNGLRRLARSWQCHFDTVAAHKVSTPRTFKPVQSLGERFLAEVTRVPLSLQSTIARAGYPVAPREY
jgi:predicted alpha/beta hydrolase family esterase